MAIPITDQTQRKYPLNQPQGWKPKMARFTLRLPDHVQELAIVAIGLQARSSSMLSETAISAIDEWTRSSPYRPLIVDKLNFVLGRDEPQSSVWMCYWTSREYAEHAVKQLNLKQIYDSLDGKEQPCHGIWLESLFPHLTRFETNYSGDDYQPGLAGLAGTKQVPHDLTGYWGAARDRIRASAYDRFEDSDDSKSSNSQSSPSSDTSPPSAPSPKTLFVPPTTKTESIDFSKATLNLHLRGTNSNTIAHIRSGQFWEKCSQEESDAYEEKLEPHLINGLNDILEHPFEKGDYGLRFLRNIPSAPQGHTRKETCAIGYFRTLQDLENWAKDCPSHHKIFGGALSHRNRFGDGYKMRTWHEISVLKPGEARWEYINCSSGTGILPFVEHEVVARLS